MLDCLKFILNCVIQFISMLFRIDVGFTNLGVVMCICYILLPMLLFIVNFLKSSLLEELDDRYDESRPILTSSSSGILTKKVRPGYVKTYSYNKTTRKRGK